jgi:hypothetical protein
MRLVLLWRPSVAELPQLASRQPCVSVGIAERSLNFGQRGVRIAAQQIGFRVQRHGVAD